MADPNRPNPYAPPGNDEPTPQPPAAPDEGGKQRGGCLTAMLVLMMIANPLVALLYLLSGDAISRALHAPSWAVPLLGILSITNFFCALGIWRFKKWGVYGALAMAALGLVINFTIGVSPGQSLMGLIGPGLLVVLVKPRWESFD